jgi:prepilin signal peptidase PulO-like enzyme (type II secretory pathway)
MSNCGEQQHELFWIYQPWSLLLSTDLIPMDYMTLDQQMNAVTRLFIMVSILMLLLNVKNMVYIFCIGLIFIVIIYLIKYHFEMKKENF